MALGKKNNLLVIENKVLKNEDERGRKKKQAITNL